MIGDNMANNSFGYGGLTNKVFKNSCDVEIK